MAALFRKTSHTFRSDSRRPPGSRPPRSREQGPGLPSAPVVARLGLGMKHANPFPALFNPYASAIVSARNVLAGGGGVLRRFICNDSDLGVWKNHFHLSE